MTRAERSMQPWDESDPPPGRRRPWLPAAITGIVVMAIAAGGLAVLVVNGGRQGTPAVANSSPAPSSTRTSTAPAPPVSDPTSPTPAPQPTQSGPESEPDLPNRAIVEVAVNALNLRSEPSEDATTLRSLHAGTELFVIGAPQQSGDYDWYRVAVDFEGECDGSCPTTIGWVATPTNASSAWIVAADVACPTPPLEVDELVQLTPLERLHCFGATEVTGTGWADNACCSYFGIVGFEPGWLAWPSSTYFRASDFYTILPYHLSGAEGSDWPTDRAWPEPGDILSWTGHFEDPAAPTCAAAFQEDMGEVAEGVELPDRATVVLACRVQLVITDYQVIGHEGEGTCGCLTPPSPAALSTGEGRRGVA